MTTIDRLLFIGITAALTMYASGCITADDLVTASAQGTWSLVHERRTALYYHGLHFVDRSSGWVVGDSGLILHTTDGGTTWTEQASRTTEALKCVYFATPLKGWIGGGSNSIGVTTDGGLTWTWVHPPGKLRRMFMALSFVSETTGWIVDNNRGIHRTDDGGMTWTEQQSGSTWALTGVHFVDASEGWAVSTNLEVLHTTNGGESWTIKQLTGLGYGSNVSVIFNDIFFFGRSRGWIATNVLSSSIASPLASVAATESGGAAWSAQSTPEGQAINALHFVSENDGWAACNGGILATTNSGSAWEYELRRTDGDPFVDIVFADRSHGWALTFTGRIYAYTRN